MPDPSHETYVSLRDYFDHRLIELDRRITGVIDDRDARIQIALTAAKEETRKAETANDARLALLNEFRGQQADEAKKYVTTEIINQRFSSLEEKVSRNENMISNLIGKSALIGGLSALAGGLVVGIVLKIIGGG